MHTGNIFAPPALIYINGKIAQIRLNFNRKWFHTSTSNPSVKDLTKSEPFCNAPISVVSLHVCE